MAILRVYPKRESSTDMSYLKEEASAESVYVVWTDSLGDSPIDIMNAPGIPSPKSSHPAIDGCVLARKSVKNANTPVVLGGVVHEIWEVTCHYEIGDGESEAEIPPWMRAWGLSKRGGGMTEWYQWCDLDGKPFCTTAGEPLNPPPPIMVPSIAMTWRRPEFASIRQSSFFERFYGAVNSTPVDGCAAKTVQITNYSLEEATWTDPNSGNEYDYLDITWEAVYKPILGYQVIVVNKGTRYLEAVEANNGSTTEYRLRYPTDEDGHKSLSEVFLDANGGWIQTPNSENIVQLEFRTYNLMDLNAIKPLY